MIPSISAPTRDEVLNLIAQAHLFGHLGLFVGTGFSKALTMGNAPNFEQLLRNAAARQNLKFNFDDANSVRGLSYPQIAAKLVDELAATPTFLGTMPTRKDALWTLKREIAAICDLQPEPTAASAYSAILAAIKPSWIITTNYDFILEYLIPDAVALLPNEAVNTRRDFVPIYHFHGHRFIPESIVVTEDDYVELLGPVEYRQLKLSLLLTESTTLMLGYSFGDINVRAAMEFSRAFPGGNEFKLQPYQSIVVQALFVPPGQPLQPAPFYGPNSEIIIHINDIYAFLQEIHNRISTWETNFNTYRNFFANILAAPDHYCQILANDPNARNNFLEALKTFPRSYRAGQMAQFFSKALTPIWDNARNIGNWHYYDVFLSIVLDVLIKIDFQQLSPILVELFSLQLALMSHYITPDGTKVLGKAYSATDMWHARKGSIPKATVELLKSYARKNQYFSMEPLLASL